ncbi:hypothetical protein N7486_000241 [Penicillium sp. IBT 16267x]|nr:hypothetical protein N7486_000241 [Penicillium sp. IBT 16267x]
MALVHMEAASCDFGYRFGDGKEAVLVSVRWSDCAGSGGIGDDFGLMRESLLWLRGNAEVAEPAGFESVDQRSPGLDQHPEFRIATISRAYAHLGK